MLPEAALGESELRLRQVVRTSRIGVFDHDHLTGEVHWSPHYDVFEALGFDRPAATVEIYTDRTHPEDRDRVAEAVLRAHDPAGDGHFSVEHRVVLPEGAIRWISIQSQTLFEDAAGGRRPARTIGSVRDITQQKESEEELRKLAALVSMSRDFVAIAMLDGRGVYLNPAGMELVGISSEEVRRKSMLDVFPEDARAEAEAGLFPALMANGYWSGESRFQNFRTGRLIDVEITAFLIRDGSSAPRYIATVTRDITEKRRAEAEKVKLEERLFQAQKMESIGRLAGGVAHDFNNELTVINGYSGMVLAKLDNNDPLRPAVEEIYKAGERAAALTRQLLAFSRKQVLQPRVLDLSRVVHGMLAMLRRLVGDKIEISLAQQAGSATIQADPHQLEQVIINLAMNARDAMPGGGRLRIELDTVASEHAPQGRYVVLSVIDSGTGMDQETRQRIFEPFFTTKPVGQGTGLGLSIVEGIVAQSGGHIDVSSEPGQGAAFQIYLPACAGQPAEDEKPPVLPTLGGSETVLVVEDLPEVRGYAVAALRAYGYRVLPAGSAAEAMDICQGDQQTIHLLLTDVMMPKMDGRELAGRLSDLRPGMKVLFMSGFSDDVIPLDGAAEEDLNFIAKPFRPEQLARKVSGLLAPASRNARILVADDEAAVRGFLRTVLERGGYEVIEAADGKQAVEEAIANRVDLVITDLVMPEQEGIETIQTLRREAPEMALIAISGAFEGRYLTLAQRLGADAVLSKPVSAETLLASVASTLEPRRTPDT